MIVCRFLLLTKNGRQRFAWLADITLSIASFHANYPLGREDALLE